MQLAANLVIAERFRLNRQLGRGGMGSVWHATHLGLDIPCAVKFIEGEFAQLPEAQARFEREAKAAAQLRSPHVVQILDHGVWQGTPYIAMELLDGEDLGKRLLRVGRIPPQQLIPIITQVARALTKAHGAGIVHRDLKPDNIYLVRDDDREIAKVLDFGIAKANTNAIEGSNTKTGAMLGTPYYMSPEQAQGTKSVDHRADLWSLAVICYQATTGQLPFISEALGDLLVKIIVSPIPVPSQVAPDVPLTFDKWWAKAASRDPAQRFQNAKEFGESLSLVFGVSQMTDVMDRGQMRQAMAEQGGQQLGGGTLGVPMVTPPGFHQTPQPGMPGNTPHPMRQSGGGFLPQQPMMGTPQPGGARTFGGSEISAAGVPQKKGGLALILAGVGALLVMGVLGIVAIFVVKGRTPAAAAQTDQPTGASTATAEKTATAAPTASSAVAPVAAADTGAPKPAPDPANDTAAATNPAATNPAANNPVANNGHPLLPNVNPGVVVAPGNPPPPNGVKPANAPPNPPPGPKKPDLGF